MRAGFSHLSATTATMVASYAARGNQPTDEMLPEAFERLAPPLLSDVECQFVMAILGHKRGRRPKLACSCEELARKITDIARPDAPPAFLEALTDRLLKPTGLTELKRSRRFQNRHDLRVRDMVIRALYRQFRDLQDGGSIVDHPVLRQLPVPQSVSSRSARALEMSHRVLSERLGYFVSSKHRFMNIVSGH